MIYLYIKTHNITGLKYLGKTIQDPYTYKGSGKRWLNHLKKHGNDVTTEVVGQFTTIEELKEISIHLSEKLNIVDSKQWANLRPETGDGGDTSHYIDYSILNRGKGQTYEQRYGLDVAMNLKKLRSEKMSETRKGRTWEEISGVEKSKPLTILASERMAKFNTGSNHSEQTKLKISQSHKGKVYAKFSCISCRKTIGLNNFTQHFQSSPSC